MPRIINSAPVIVSGAPSRNSTRQMVHLAKLQQACMMSTPASSSMARTRRLFSSTSTPGIRFLPREMGVPSGFSAWGGQTFDAGPVRAEDVASPADVGDDHGSGLPRFEADHRVVFAVGAHERVGVFGVDIPPKLLERPWRGWSSKIITRTMRSTPAWPGAWASRARSIPSRRPGKTSMVCEVYSGARRSSAGRKGCAGCCSRTDTLRRSLPGCGWKTFRPLRPSRNTSAAGRSSGSTSRKAPFVVDPDGRRVPEEAVVKHLRFARVTRLSIEANAGFCRGVLAARNRDAAGVDKQEATL